MRRRSAPCARRYWRAGRRLHDRHTRPDESRTMALFAVGVGPRGGNHATVVAHITASSGRAAERACAPTFVVGAPSTGAALARTP